jgi:hypothetical protein
MVKAGFATGKLVADIIVETLQSAGVKLERCLARQTRSAPAA